MSRNEPRIVQPSVKEAPEQPVPGTPTTQEPSAKNPPVKRKHVVNGVELTAGQTRILLDGGHIFLENMTKKDGIGKLSAFVFLCDEKKNIFYSYDDPDKFVKYGNWEMRVRDKQQIEAGHITRAKIKYHDGGLARPYLWKPDASKDEAAAKLTGYKLEDNSQYYLSWGDPRKTEQGQTNMHSNKLTQTTPEAVANTDQAGGRIGVDTLTEASSALGGLFDIDPNNPAEDPDEQALKLKKPKKKRGRRV